ncbi:MAG: hypothetical protein QM783_18260 [Phycisphaerales bacterium]
MELLKVVPAEGEDEVALVLEVDVQGAGRVLDGVGDLAHRDLLVAIAYEQIPCCGQNPLVHIGLFACSPVG